MRWIRWTLIIVISLSIHAGLAMAWIFNQPNLARDPEPMTIAMISFAALNLHLSLLNLLRRQ
ncbi:hypothetical protein AB6F55_10850 [Providencia hangzhouensis]